MSKFIYGEDVYLSTEIVEVLEEIGIDIYCQEQVNPWLAENEEILTWDLEEVPGDVEVSYVNVISFK